MGAAAVFFPRPTEPFARVPYRQATWPSAARKAYACLMYFCYLRGIKDGRIIITDWAGAEWCNRQFGGDPYGSTGQRCWQKGLQQLERMGVISRERGHGRRVIVIHVNHPQAKPKAPPRPKAKPAPAKAPAPTPPTPRWTAPAHQDAAAQPDDTPLDSEARAFWARFRVDAKGRDKGHAPTTAGDDQAEIRRRRDEAARRFGTDHHDGHRPARE